MWGAGTQVANGMRYRKGPFLCGATDMGFSEGKGVSVHGKDYTEGIPKGERPGMTKC